MKDDLRVFQWTVFFLILALVHLGCRSTAPSIPTEPGKVISGKSKGVSLDYYPLWEEYFQRNINLRLGDDTVADKLMGALYQIDTKFVRIPIGQRANDEVVHRFASRFETLGILDKWALFDKDGSIKPLEDWKEYIDSVIATFPEIRYWEGPNEPLNISPDLNIPEFVARMKWCHSYFAKRGFTFIVSFPGGDVLDGPDHLKRFIDAGLGDINGVILNIHTYLSAVLLEDYLIQINRVKNARVWVTECGVPYWDLQLPYVSNDYYLILTKLNPEKVFWWCLWDGDEAVGWSEWSLIKIGTNGEIIPSPMYAILSKKKGKGGNPLSFLSPDEVKEKAPFIK